MPNEPSPLLLAFAFVAVIIGGMGTATQAPVNAVLNRAFDDPLLVACVSFFVGFVVLLLVWLASLAVRPTGFSLPEFSSVPWWAWIGGSMGGLYVIATLWAVPKLGMLTIVAALVLGQMLAALIIDTTGAFGLIAREISPTRILAVVLVLGGLFLSRV